MINLVDFFFRSASKNSVLMFIFIICTMPILFLCVAEIAEKYLVVLMQDLASKFKMSPTLAAVTLIAFANGCSEVFTQANLGAKKDGLLLGIATNMGGTIFNIGLVLPNVVFASKSLI